MNETNRTTKKLWLLLVIFFLPVLIGWLLFHYHGSFHFKTMNKGVLINPPIHSEVFNTLDAQHHWQIIYMPGDHCDKQCDEVMFNLHQLHVALGKESPRVVVKMINKDQQSGVNFLMEHRIYLVDPANNVFMYYQDTSNLMGIRECAPPPPACCSLEEGDRGRRL
jgi:hypothetical protein